MYDLGFMISDVGKDACPSGRQIINQKSYIINLPGLPLRRIVDPRLPTCYPLSVRESLAIIAIGAGRRTREDCGD